MAETHISTDHPAVKAEPSVFTGDGIYELRNGDRLFIEKTIAGALVCRENERASISPQYWDACGKWGHREPTQYDIVARVDEPAEAAKEEFRITGPGRYERRDKTFTTIIDNDNHARWPWTDEDLEGYTNAGYVWDESGPDPKDIVAGPFPDEAAPQADAKELAELTGYGVFKAGFCTHVAQYPDAEKEAVRQGQVVIDLSTITKDQLVQPKPEPKRVKQKVWIKFYTDRVGGGCCAATDRGLIGELDAEAIVEHEIEYTPGEGL